MRLTKMQLMLLRLSLGKPFDGLWYPHPKQYLDGELIYIDGGGIASSIRSLFTHGLAEPVADLHPYAFRITDKGRTAVQQRVSAQGASSPA